jgi:hypothetical protein
VSRHGYSSDCENVGMWRGVIASAVRGKRGQAFFRALVAALDAMPDKRLVRGELEDKEGSVCALGCLAKTKGATLDPEDTYEWDKLGEVFDIAPQLAQETMYINDEWGRYGTPEDRWAMVREWAAKKIRIETGGLKP